MDGKAKEMTVLPSTRLHLNGASPLYHGLVHHCMRNMELYPLPTASKFLFCQLESITATGVIVDYLLHRMRCFNWIDFHSWWADSLHCCSSCWVRFRQHSSRWEHLSLFGVAPYSLVRRSLWQRSLVSIKDLARLIMICTRRCLKVHLFVSLLL